MYQKITENFSFSELQEFFVDVGLPNEIAIQYAAKCVENDVNMNVLMRLDENHLKELSMSMGHRVMILHYIQDVSSANMIQSLFCCNQFYIPQAILTIYYHFMLDEERKIDERTSRGSEGGWNVGCKFLKFLYQQ